LLFENLKFFMRKSIWLLFTRCTLLHRNPQKESSVFFRNFANVIRGPAYLVPMLGNNRVEFRKLLWAQAIVLNRLHFATCHRAIYRLLETGEVAVFFSFQLGYEHKIQSVGAESGVCRVFGMETISFTWSRLGSGAQETIQIFCKRNAMF
jgi:hypothetical protein